MSKEEQLRSEMMSHIRSKNTLPELVFRKRLFSRGFRYSLHKKSLPGKPDIVLTKYNTVVFIHGCFWHMHNCSLFKLPKTRTAFWEDKLSKNKMRDIKQKQALINMGWRVAIIWECAIKNKKDTEITIMNFIEWLVNTDSKQIVLP